MFTGKHCNRANHNGETVELARRMGWIFLSNKSMPNAGLYEFGMYI
jgi:hypothetical protein